LGERGGRALPQLGGGKKRGKEKERGGARLLVQGTRADLVEEKEMPSLLNERRKEQREP